MARAISSLPNTVAPDSDYPDGRYKDKVGSNPGTRLNEAMLGDQSQFFAKIMREAGVAFNDLPDSEYNGIQLYQALLGLFGGMRRTIYPIGAWDMDTDAIKIVTATVDMAAFRGASFVILTDAQANAYINGGDSGETKCTIGATSSGFVLARVAGSVFDGTNFNDTGVNRGYIILETYEL